MIAINDAFLLETFVFQILKKHFRAEPIYMQLVEIFHDVGVPASYLLLIYTTVGLTLHSHHLRSSTARSSASFWT